MMMPSIFGENLFNDWMDFSFPDIDKKLYGKRADRISCPAVIFPFFRNFVSFILLPERLL